MCEAQILRGLRAARYRWCGCTCRRSSRIGWSSSWRCWTESPSRQCPVYSDPLNQVPTTCLQRYQTFIFIFWTKSSHNFCKVKQKLQITVRIKAPRKDDYIQLLCKSCVVIQFNKWAHKERRKSCKFTCVNTTYDSQGIWKYKSLQITVNTKTIGLQICHLKHAIEECTG